MYGKKEETFLWGYETIFNWLDINFDGNHKEHFWKAIIYDISNNQEQMYEIRLRQIMEFEEMEQNSNGGMKLQERLEKRELKISKADYFKIETNNYCVVRTLS
jgi:hypothetical protein